MKDIVLVPSYSANKVVLLFAFGAAVRYSVATISGTSISVTAPAQINNWGTTMVSVKGVEIGASKIAIAVHVSDNGVPARVLACTIASDTLTCGTTVAVPTANSATLDTGNRSIALAKAATDKVLLTYHTNTIASGGLTTVAASVSGTTVTMGTNYTGFGGANTYFSHVYSGVDNRVLTWSTYSGGTLYHGPFDTSNINSLVYNYGGSQSGIGVGTFVDSSISQIDNSRIAFLTTGTTGIKLHVGTTTAGVYDNATTNFMPIANMASTTVTTTPNANSSGLSVVSMGASGIIVVAYSDTGSSNDIVTRNFQLGASSGCINAGGTYGIARTTNTSGNSGTIALFGSLVSGLSSLVPGTL